MYHDHIIINIQDYNKIENTIRLHVYASRVWNDSTIVKGWGVKLKADLLITIFDKEMETSDPKDTVYHQKTLR